MKPTEPGRKEILGLIQQVHSISPSTGVDWTTAGLSVKSRVKTVAATRTTRARTHTHTGPRCAKNSTAHGYVSRLIACAIAVSLLFPFLPSLSLSHDCSCIPWTLLALSRPINRLFPLFLHAAYQLYPVPAIDWMIILHSAFAQPCSLAFFFFSCSKD